MTININPDIINEEGNSNANVNNGENPQSGGDAIDYKERYASSTREYQRIADEKKAIENDVVIQKASRQVIKDNNYLLEMDEDLGKQVFEELLEDGWVTSGATTYEELVEQLRGYTSDDEPVKPVNEEEIVKKVKATLIEEQRVEKALDVLSETLSKFDEETRNKYLEEFEEVLGDRKLTPEFAKKEIEKIIFYNNREDFKKQKDDEALINIASNGVGKTKGGEGTSMSKEKLSSYGMPEAEQRRLYPELFPKN